MKMKVSSPVVGVVSCEYGLGDRLHVLGTWVVHIDRYNDLQKVSGALVWYASLYQT